MQLRAGSRYFVRADEVTPYHPANHTGTVNRRLIGHANVGAMNLEVVLGVIEKGKGRRRTPIPASSRSATCRPGAPAPRSAARAAELEAGDCCFFPADMPHAFTV